MAIATAPVQAFLPVEVEYRYDYIDTFTRYYNRQGS